MTSIGQLSYYFGLHRNTLRRLEEQGLIKKPQRTAGGFRDYSPQDVASIKVYLDNKHNRIKADILDCWQAEELAGWKPKV